MIDIDVFEFFKSRIRDCAPAGDGFKGFCPAHESNGDHTSKSLTFCRGESVPIIAKCHSLGCTFKEIVEAVGLTEAQACGRSNGFHHAAPPVSTVTPAPAEADRDWFYAWIHHYQDASGAVVYDKVRKERVVGGQREKKMWIAVPKGNGQKGWIKGGTLKRHGLSPILFGLDKLVKLQRTVEATGKPASVLVSEGEKKCELLWALGFHATTSPYGGGKGDRKWLAEFNPYLRGLNVILLADDDKPGRAFADHVAGHVHAVAAGLRIVTLTGDCEGFDVFDWFAERGVTYSQQRGLIVAEGRDLESVKAEFVEIVKQSPAWKPRALASQADGERAIVAPLVTHVEAAGTYSSPVDSEPLAEIFLAAVSRHVLVNSLVHFQRVGSYFTPADVHFRANVREHVANRVSVLNLREQQQDEKKPRMYRVTAGLVSDVIDAIKAKIPRIEGQPPLWLSDCGRSRNCQSFKNGILDFDRLLERGPEPFFEHTPEFFTTVLIPYNYEPEATCPNWFAFLQRNLEADPQRIAILQEFFGYALTPDTSFHAFLLMHGEGSNGKSVVCSVLRGMLGDDNVSTVPLEVFGERFQLNATLDKLANIAAEVGEIDKVAEGHIKSFVSGDPMTFERKFRDPIVASPTAKLVLACNTLPRIADRSEGIWRRMIVMPFNVVIRPQERVRGMDSVEWWANKGELPGVLNWAIEGLRRLRTQGRFTVSQMVEDAREEFRTEVNPVRQFLADNYREQAEIELSKASVYTAYKAWAESTGHRPLADGPFGKEVLRTFPNVKPERRRLGNGIRTQVYVGLGLGATQDASDPFDVGQGSQGRP
jgi:P4 family phage/plasmid primase-like protien